MKRSAVVLGQGGHPDWAEARAVARLRLEGFDARYVRVLDPRDKEDAEVAVSRHAEFLRPYAITERIIENTPEVAAEDVPSGFPPLPPGYSLVASGPRFSLRNENGTQIHEKMLYKAAMADLIRDINGKLVKPVALGIDA